MEAATLSKHAAAIILARVRFNHREEFTEELSRDGDLVYRNIVRVTRRYRESAHGPMTYVSVVATAIVGQTVLRLEKACGELFPRAEGQPPMESDERAERKCRALIEALEAELQKLGLDVRPGVFEELNHA